MKETTRELIELLRWGVGDVLRKVPESQHAEIRLRIATGFWQTRKRLQRWNYRRWGEILAGLLRDLQTRK